MSAGDPGAPTSVPTPAPLRVRTPAFLVDQLVVTLLVAGPALAVVLFRGDGKRLGDWAGRTLVVGRG